MELKIRYGLRYRTTNNRVITLIEFDDNIEIITQNLSGRKLGDIIVPLFDISDAMQVSECVGFYDKRNLFLVERLFWVSDSTHSEMLVIVSKNGDKQIVYSFESFRGIHSVPRNRKFNDCEGIKEDIERIYEKYKE